MKRVRRKLEIKDPERHYQLVLELFDRIAQIFDKTRGDVVIAYHQDISVYNARQWLVRPIPKRHWRFLAKLANTSVEEIEKIALS